MHIVNYKFWGRGRFESAKVREFHLQTSHKLLTICFRCIGNSGNLERKKFLNFTFFDTIFLFIGICVQLVKKQEW